MIFQLPVFIVVGLWFMVFNSTLNNISAISWRSVLLVEEKGEPKENHDVLFVALCQQKDLTWIPSQHTQFAWCNMQKSYA
jgi:hypothetical protein